LAGYLKSRTNITGSSPPSKAIGKAPQSLISNWPTPPLRSNYPGDCPSGAGSDKHFLEVINRTKAEVTLADGILPLQGGAGTVKKSLKDKVEIRPKSGSIPFIIYRRLGS
jgi:hypothetical protein